MKAIDAEYWDLFNEDRVYIGEKHLRGKSVPDGRFHLVVHSWIMDADGYFLISQRQKGRSNSLKWERTGGSVLAGEDSLRGAIREVNEELGIDVSTARTFFIKTEKRTRFHDFVDSWLFVIPSRDVPITIDPVEVADYAWVSYRVLKKMKSHNLLVNTSQYIDEVYRVFVENCTFIKDQPNNPDCEAVDGSL